MKKVLILFLSFSLLFSSNLYSAKKKKRRKKPIYVPVDVGIGPAFNQFFGPIKNNDSQVFHYGLKIDVYAIINKALIKKYKNRIPKKYRKAALRLKEITYHPFWWLPDTIFISPKTKKTSVFGVTFRPIGIGLSLLNNRLFKLSLGAGFVLTYLYIKSDTFTNIENRAMHFLRPGIDLKAELLLKLSKTFLISGGWNSYFYIPQEVNNPDKGILAIGKLDNSLWHIGQFFVMLHFRFPYRFK